ncbi:TPA: hypothetical protein ACTYYZ_002750 [Enterobacter hormaechei]|nr:hypothetical protein [Citrobacter freundii]
MMAKMKPLSIAERKVIRKLATAFVCADAEINAVAKVYEEQTGKPYNRNAPDSYLNVFLNSDPECKRLWTLLQKDILATSKQFADGLRRERDS